MKRMRSDDDESNQFMLIELLNFMIIFTTYLPCEASSEVEERVYPHLRKSLIHEIGSLL